MREIFARWGLPEALRVDNGEPWGTWSDLPPQWSLWVMGLGIEMIWNPPGKPQDNGVVERSHRTQQNWVDLKQCSSIQQVHNECDQMDRLQREYYALPGGFTRLQF